MKRILILISFLCIVISVSARSKRTCYYFDIFKRADKIISVDNFWEDLLLVNKNYKKFQRTFTKGGNTIRDTYYEYQKAALDITTLRKSYEDARVNKDLSDSLKTWLRLDSVKTLLIPEIYILPIEEYNAFTYPYETKMAFATENITKLLDKEELIACMAHEMAHYYLAHQLVRMYTCKKREKSNRFWASFGTAVYAGTVAGSNMFAASQGAEPLNVDYGRIVSTATDLFSQAAEHATMMYEFRYSREQEMEADIIALAFLRKSGIDENKVISCLEKLEPYSTKIRDKSDDHPLISDRIKLLKKIIRLCR